MDLSTLYVILRMNNDNNTDLDRYIYLSSYIINIIFESFKLSINMKHKAPENGIHYEDCQRQNKPKDIDHLHVTEVVVPEDDGEGDDDTENDTAQTDEAVEDEPGQHGPRIVGQSPAHEDTVDSDRHQGVDTLTSEASVGLTSLVQLWSIPEHEAEDGLDTDVVMGIVLATTGVAAHQEVEGDDEPE